MQNKTEVQNKKKDAKGFFANISSKQKERSVKEVRDRMKTVATAAMLFVLSYILGGSEWFFGTYPLGIALLCASGMNLIPIFSGLMLCFVRGRISVEYLFAYLAVLLVRFIISYSPDAYGKLRDGQRDLSESEIDEQRKRVEDSEKQPSSFKGLNFLYRIADIFGIERESEYTSKDQKRIFCENITFRMLCAGVGGFVAGLFGLIESNFEYYDLYAALFLIVFSPLCAALLSGICDKRAVYRGMRYTLSYGAAMFFCTYASRSMNIFGMPMQPMLALLFTLCVASRRGLPLGIMTALLCGVVFNLSYVPLLVICVILFCLISPLKKTAGLAAVCAAVVVWCYYFGSTSGLVGVLPPMLLSIPVFLLADKYFDFAYPDQVKASSSNDGVYFAAAITEQGKNEATKEKLNSLSEAFSSLSETFYKLSDRFRRPDVLGLKKLTDDSFYRVCDGCRNRDVCWGVNYSGTLEAQRCITSSLHAKGGVEMGDVPQEFASCCMRLDKIVADVNTSCAEITERIIKQEKIGVFASNYESITEILKDALECDRDEYECDTNAAGKVYEYLTKVGFDVKGVVVCGKRYRRVLVKGVGLSDGGESVEAGEMCRRISDIVGLRMSGPVFEVGADGTLMLFGSKPSLRAICSHGRIAACEDFPRPEDESLYVDPFLCTDEEKRERMCGDATDAFLTDGSYFYSLISDGMGSGSDAAFHSGISAMFIEKMLSAGNRADITLRMLNNFLKSENSGCGSECSVTVDLMELDLMSGVASFIKSGAAPTYILRNRTVYKVNSRTMPIGIMDNPDARITKFDMKQGDLVVMVSDGCCPDSDDCPWLVDMLGEIEMPERKDIIKSGEDFADKLRDRILRAAREKNNSDHERDDVSVSVVLVA